MPISLQVRFRFHGSLNEFPLRKKRQPEQTLLLKQGTTVKDAVESMGVPHVETQRFVVNGTLEDQAYRLQHNDQIDVFPFENHFPENTPKSFVLDVHLGKLARLLRMLGIDAFHQNNVHDKQMVALAGAESRTVLTRDVGLLMHKVLRHGYWLRSQNPEQQLLEVIRMFSLCPLLKPFTRCLACNGGLQPVQKSRILTLLPENTKAVFQEFYQCEQCGKLYWKGSHHGNMERLIHRITSLACHG